MTIENHIPPGQDDPAIVPGPVDPHLLPEVAPPDHPAAMTLDPFGFVPDHISRIGGLGGDMPGPIERYAFHTAYVPLDEGFRVFIMAFDGLVATRGTIELSVHAMSPRPGALAHAIEVRQIPLRMLAEENDGRLSIAFEALDGVTYSLFGQIFDETDAHANGLAVDLWRRADLDAEQEQALAGRRTEFAATNVKPIARIVSGDRPMLANPVSQMGTVRQLAEPVYREWRGLLGLADDDDDGDGDGDDVQGWGQAYVMQALRRYGMLAAKARGLGFGVGASSLPAAMAAAGCTITATDPDDGGLDALRRTALIPDSTFDARVAFRTVAPGALPGDLTDFDFLWSLGMDARIGSPAATIAFIDDAMRCLKPGGVAVHVLRYDQATRGAAGQSAGPFRRQDMERLALALISRGHEIAQFKYEADDALSVPGPDGAVMAYGVIARAGVFA